MNESQVRKYIRKFITEIDLNEVDVLVKKTKEKMLSKESDWKEDRKKMSDNLKELLKHINSDSHKESDEMIDEVIAQLKNWKKRIKKFL